MTELIDRFPHCDSRILHAPGECDVCDKFPLWQELRKLWGIAFTGHRPRAELQECGTSFLSWPGSKSVAKCRRAEGHPGDDAGHGHSVLPEWEGLPCPADHARPAGALNDHRNWGGNRPWHEPELTEVDIEDL